MLQEILVYAAIPMVVLAAAGVAASNREPGPRLRSALLHLAAGVVFAVVAVELLPDLMQEHAVVVTAIGFAAGTGAMLGIRELTRRAEERARKRPASAGAGGRALPVGMLFAAGVDLVIDGLVLGVAFTAGSKQGVLLTAALSVEMGSLGLAMAASLRERGVAARQASLGVCGLALLFGVSAVAGGVSLRSLPDTALAAFLAFGSAALLYLVTEELLTEAHEIPESPLLTAVFFLGFIALFLIEMASR